MPPFATHDCAATAGRLFRHLGQGFLRHVLVEVAPRLVHRLQLVGQLVRRVVVRRHQQLDGLEGVAHAAGRVDPRPQGEADVSHGVGHALDVGHLQHGPDAGTHGLAQLPHAVVGQDAVFAGDVHKVGPDAQGQKVEVVVHRGHGQSNAVHQRSQQLERNPSSGQLLERVGASFLLGVEQGGGDRQRVGRQVVVAHDGVDAHLSRRCKGVKIFGPAVQGDQHRAPRHLGAFHPFGRDPVSFAVAHGDVGNHGNLEPSEERRHHGHRRGAVDVVVAVHHDAFLALDGLQDAGHSFVHVLHQKRIVELLAVGVEEVVDRLRRGHASLDQQGCNQRAETRVL